MFYKIKEWPRKIRQGIKSLIIWFPVIWKDRWWDHYFIYAILRHKLYLMEKNIRAHGHHVNHIEDADKIKKCVVILDRLMNDEYHEEAFKGHYEKWGKPDFRFEKYEDSDDLQELHIDYPNVQSAEDKEAEAKDFRVFSQLEVDMREKDLDDLFNDMREHIQTWWD